MEKDLINIMKSSTVVFIAAFLGPCEDGSYPVKNYTTGAVSCQDGEY